MTHVPLPPRSPDRPTTTVLLPAFNEEEALPHVLADLERELDDAYEIIVVDDGSSDGTAAAAAARGVRVVAHDDNRGKGAAIRTGLSAASGTYVVVMDADATYPAAAIPQMVRLMADRDLVRCTRSIDARNMPLLNRVGNRVFNRILSLAHGLDGGDHMSGLYGMRRTTFTGLDLASDGFDVEVEIGIKARLSGLSTVDLPITYHPRIGTKKLHPVKDGARILTRILGLMVVHRPLLSFVVPGALLATVSMIAAIVLTEDRVVTSYLGLSIHTFIIAALGVLTGLQLALLGVAASLYRVEIGYPAGKWLVTLVDRRVRLTTAGIGAVMTIVAAAALAWMIVRWITAGTPAFTSTRNLVLASTTLVLGLQLVSGAMILSIFGGRIGTPSAPPHPPAS